MNPSGLCDIAKERWESCHRRPKFDGYLVLKSPFLEVREVREVPQNANEETVGGSPVSTADATLPQMGVGDTFNILQIELKDCVEPPPPPYSTADLIKTLEKTGIGRPSTFSSIFEKIKSRGYVTLGINPAFNKELACSIWVRGDSLKQTTYTQKLGGQKNICTVTPLGISVTDFLETHCGPLLQTNFTAQLEENLDKIARGQMSWDVFVSAFYAKTKAVVDAIQPAESLSGDKKSGDKKPIHWVVLFDDMSRDGKQVGIVQTRNGPAIAQECNGTLENYFSLPPKSKPDTLKSSEAMYITSLPRVIGEYEGTDVNLFIGRYGWYVKIGTDKTVSFGETRKPPTLEDVRTKIQEASSTVKNQRLCDVSAMWSVWYNPTKQSHFLMKKKAKGGVSFHKLPTYNPETRLSEKDCEAIAVATKSTPRVNSKRK